MDKSESIVELAKALSKAQSQIKGAKKDSANPFFKSSYADLSSVVEAIKEPLTTNGLSYVQISHERENAAAIETLIMHSSGEWLSCGVMSVPVNKADAQGYGSSATYCRRYSLSAAFGVAPEDDDGNAATNAKPGAKKDPVKAELQSEFPTGHEKVPGTDKTVGQVVDENLAMEKIPEAESRDAIRKIAKAIEGDFYTLTAKAAVERLQKERAAMNETEYDALWGAMPATLRANLKKCEDAMRKAA